MVYMLSKMCELDKQLKCILQLKNQRCLFLLRDIFQLALDLWDKFWSKSLSRFVSLDNLLWYFSWYWFSNLIILSCLLLITYNLFNLGPHLIVNWLQNLHLLISKVHWICLGWPHNFQILLDLWDVFWSSSLSMLFSLGHLLYCFGF
jgi:hypothetical protein